MVRDIYRTDPDGDIDFDGYEEEEDPEDVAERDFLRDSYLW